MSSLSPEGSLLTASHSKIADLFNWECARRFLGARRENSAYEISDIKARSFLAFNGLNKRFIARRPCLAYAAVAAASPVYDR